MSILNRRTIAVSLALASLTACTYSPTRYDGDGTITSDDKAAWKHEIALDTIPLLVPGSYTFRLGGLPSEHMLSLLSVDTVSPETYSAIEKSNVRVKMTIINLSDGSASVKEGRLLGDYDTTYEGWAGSTQGLPSEFKGPWFRPMRHDAFTLRIDVSVDTPQNSPAVTATPRVRGRPSGAMGGVGDYLPNLTGGS